MQYFKTIVIALIFGLGFISLANAQSVGVSSSGAYTPNTNAILDLDDVAGTKGALLPRMTATERGPVVGVDFTDGLGAGDAGMTIYNTTSNAYNYWDGAAWQVVSTAGGGADVDWYKVLTTTVPTAIGDWMYTNGNVGINIGASVNPYAALHVKSNIYVGDNNTGTFFNSNAIIHVARTNNPHILIEDVGANTGGLTVDAGGMNVVTENGDIDFRTGVTGAGDWSATGNVRMTILNDGKVGIGTTPNQELEVSGTARISTLAGSGNRAVYADNDGDLTLSTSTIDPNSLVDGSGTLNYLSKWTPDGNSLGDSQVFDNGTNVGVGTATPDRN